MIKKGDHANPVKVLPIDERQGIVHELAGDFEVTKFKITDRVTDDKGTPKKYPDGHYVPVFILVTVWSNVPIAVGDYIRLLDINDLSFYQKYNPKKRQYQMFYSISARIEKI
jgi:hypothetical protein